MIVDYLNITVPDSDSRPVTSEVALLLSEIGAFAVSHELYRMANSGTFKISVVRSVRRYSASGGALALLRQANLLDHYLAAFSEVPHRVTQMHIAQDIQTDAAPILSVLQDRVVSDAGVYLTRKRICPHSQYNEQLNPRRSDGVRSGSLYFGRRTAEVRAIVYDKQKERMDRAALDIPPTIRFELSVTGKVGATLRDAHFPEPIFWHYMGDLLKGVLRRPPSVPDWVAHAAGYTLPKPSPLLPARALSRLVSSHPFLSSVAEIASQVGPEGSRLALRYIEAELLTLINKTDSVRGASGGSLDRVS